MPEKISFIQELPPDEQITTWLNEVVEFIDRQFGVLDLTTTEILQIRNLVIQARDLNLDLKQRHLDKGDWAAYGRNKVQVLDEVLTRYLDYYGIDAYTIGAGSLNKAFGDPKNLEYIKSQLRQARHEHHKP